MGNNQRQRSSDCHSQFDLLHFAEELRKIRNEEEERFDRRFKEAVGAWKFRAGLVISVVLTVFTGLATIAIYTCESFVKNVVNDKVRSEFESYTKRRIENGILDLSKDLKLRIAECEKAKQRIDNELHLVRLYSESMAGSASSYRALKESSRDNESGKTLVAAVEAFYCSQMVRRNDNYCMIELAWRFKKVSDEISEIRRKVELDDEVSFETVNLIVNLASCENAQKYAELFIKKAEQCGDLSGRMVIIDCLHALYDDCPCTPDVEEIKKWWAGRKNESL